jgi:hypothetical protein
MCKAKPGFGYAEDARRANPGITQNQREIERCSASRETRVIPAAKSSAARGARVRLVVGGARRRRFAFHVYVDGMRFDFLRRAHAAARSTATDHHRQGQRKPKEGRGSESPSRRQTGKARGTKAADRPRAGLGTGAEEASRSRPEKDLSQEGSRTRRTAAADCSSARPRSGRR